MTIVRDTDLSKFYTIDDKTGWYSVDFENIKYKDQAIEIATQCTSDARMERFKAFSTAVMGVGVVLLLSEVSTIAFKIGALSLGIFALPLIIVPPLYGLVTFLGGLGAGGAFLYFTFNKFCIQFFQQAQEHWNYGNHLYAEALRARLQAPDLASAKA